MLRRYSAAFLAMVIVLSVSIGLKLPAKAATVDYVYSGTYIYNWGNREELATFLSPKAEDFYDKNDTSLDSLLALDGSSSNNSVPSSTLYKKLQSIMKSNHSYQTTYAATRDKFQYTDCENSGKTSKRISSFYSGDPIGPEWDGGDTWNREHTWPNSKGDQAGNGENDIMMLRPTAKSENGSRGNKAYGEGTTYYNPNSESGGKHDLRGDVARIMLYQYVRWGATDKMWGSSGVIESKAILLKWMEEDPVDTWELGRNDSVQSITGTRNVFVDFPELAFDLFHEDIPNDYKSPSSSTTSSGYKITATSNNTAWGKVSVNRNTITASAANGYEAIDFDIVSGNATVERIGDDFIVNTSANVVIQINFAPIRTVSFIEDGQSARKSTTGEGNSITLPSHKTAVKTGYTFLGWVTSSIGDTEKKPAYFAAGDKYTVSGNVSLYALYSRKVNGKVVYFTNSPSSSKPSSSTSSNPQQNTSSKPAGSTSSKVEQNTNSKPSTSKPTNSTPIIDEPATSKPITNTSSNAAQNVGSNPQNDTSSLDDEQDTSSVPTENETDNNFVSVNLSESTTVVSDFIEQAINNNIPLVLKAKDYTWTFEKLMITADEARNFDAAILTGDKIEKEDLAIVKKAADGKKFYAIDFANEGALPAKAIITLRVDEAFAGKNVEIYSLTPSGKKILEGTATVSGDSVLRFETEHTSLMFIADAESGGASLLWLWIVLAVLLAGSAVAVFILYKKGIIFNTDNKNLD